MTDINLIQTLWKRDALHYLTTTVPVRYTFNTLRPTDSWTPLLTSTWIVVEHKDLSRVKPVDYLPLFYKWRLPKTLVPLRSKSFMDSRGTWYNK